jgi:hypothetical protein
VYDGGLGKTYYNLPWVGHDNLEKMSLDGIYFNILAYNYKAISL